MAAKTKARSKRAKEISALCYEAIDRFQPDDNYTYCNVAVNYIATNIGYAGFNGLLANQIVRKMIADAEWAEVDEATAKNLADDGCLVVAGIQDDPHGHVAVVLPGGPLVYSRKWNKKCPTVASAGKRNWVIGANWAFSKCPKYWALVEG